MRLRFAAAAIALAAASGSAQTQTASEKLEKAIHTQEAAGDIDAAIQMYREIVTSAPAQRQFAALAQLRLAQALLQKGDLIEAQREFQNLAFNYSEYKDVIAAAAGRTRGVAFTRGPSISLGKFENGRYHHNITGVEFNVPSGFQMQGDSDSSDGGEMVVLTPNDTQGVVAVWLKPSAGGGNVTAQLKEDLDRKPSMRTEYQDWKVRPESVTMRTVAGQQALTAIADFTDGGRKMVEYMTWVRSPKSRVFLFGRAQVERLATLGAHVEQILGSALIP